MCSKPAFYCICPFNCSDIGLTISACCTNSSRTAKQWSVRTKPESVHKPLKIGALEDPREEDSLLAFVQDTGLAASRCRAMMKVSFQSKQQPGLLELTRLAKKATQCSKARCLNYTTKPHKSKN